MVKKKWGKKLGKKKQKLEKWGWKKNDIKKISDKKKMGEKKILLNMGQNILWWEAYTYKWCISIFEVVASELLFGLGVNGTEFFLIMFRIFKWVVFPYDFWKKINSFRILLGISWYVFKPLLSDFQWTAEVLDHI